MPTDILLKPIGIINTIYNEPKDIPIQGVFKKNIQGRIKIYQQFTEGLKDLEGFSHIILIYYFHRSEKEKTLGKPFLENTEHGIFAIRSPNRPNHIGLSVVKLERIENTEIIFSGVDMLNETPLLDIKPYVSYFDTKVNVKNGWIDKHFTDGKIPDDVILK